MSTGTRTFMVSGYLPEALNADGTVKEEHRCPLCPGPGEAITIDFADLGGLAMAEAADPADLGDFGRLGDLAQLLAVPTPPARGGSRGKRRRRR
jgi:hypothetical protein